MIRSNKPHLGLIILVMGLITLTAAFALGLVLGGAESSSNLLEQADGVSETVIEFPSCRYGASGGSAINSSAQVEWLDDLGAGWYANFQTDAGGEAANGAEFVPLIWVQQHKEGSNYLPTYSVTPQLTEGGLGQLVDARPGTLWIVGNEVDRGAELGVTPQGDTLPDMYAKVYHDVYWFIKDRDPTALVAISGLVEVTPGRLQYLDLVWKSYLDRYHVPIPVDVWNMHIYILPEVTPQGQPNGIASVAVGTDPALGKKESYDPDGKGPLKHSASCPLEDIYCIAEHDDRAEFAGQVEAMRNWMAEHGQRNKPLILSEFSLLYPYEQDGGSCWLQDEFGKCFTQERVLEYMDSTLSYLISARNASTGFPLDDNRLVQQWLWFSIANTPRVGNISDLVAYDDQANKLTGLTSIGTRFRTWAQAEATIPNLLPGGQSSSVAFSGGPGDTAEATLKIAVGNNGNIAVTEPFSVTFYSDSKLNEVISSVDLSFPVPGCARRTMVAQVTWSGLSPGLHRYWAKIDSHSHVVEANESDNVISGFVIVDPQQTIFPIVRR